MVSRLKAAALPRISRLTANFGPVWRRRRDRFILTGVHHDGPSLGRFCDAPISALVVDEGGHVYRYVGIMPCKASGAYELDKLAPEEWIVPPGLIYLRQG